MPCPDSCHKPYLSISPEAKYCKPPGYRFCPKWTAAAGTATFISGWTISLPICVKGKNTARHPRMVNLLRARTERIISLSRAKSYKTGTMASKASERGRLQGKRSSGQSFFPPVSGNSNTVACLARRRKRAGFSLNPGSRNRRRPLFPPGRGRLARRMSSSRLLKSISELATSISQNGSSSVPGADSPARLNSIGMSLPLSEVHILWQFLQY